MATLVFSFVGSLFVFLLIGLASLFQRRKTAQDYLVTGKSTPAWLAGLSAVATNNSGYMFVGMIGLTWQVGLSSIWLMVGWIVGDFMASLTAAPGVRRAARRPEVDSFGDLLSFGQPGSWVTLRRVTGLLTTLFLTLYAGAQLTAGAKATAIMLQWPLWWGTVIGALIVLLYSAAGGLRASIWTDAAQSFVMLFGMIALMIIGLDRVGGVDMAMTRFASVDPAYLDLFPQKSYTVALLGIIGWMFGGFVVVGQPHIVIRLVSMDERASLNQMRLSYYSWFIFFYGATIAVGMLARLLAPGGEGFDPETALPVMAMTLLPPWGAGLILAALFAATLSTADSLVLACSASVTRDLSAGSRHSLSFAKGATIMVTLTATAISLWGDQSVFSLVLDAWGLLGSAFVPLLVLTMRGVRITPVRAMTMVIAGVGAFLLWQSFGYSAIIYAAAVGVTVGFLVAAPYRTNGGDLHRRSG